MESHNLSNAPSKLTPAQRSIVHASLRDLQSCDMADSDVDDGHLTACFDTFGRSNIETL